MLSMIREKGKKRRENYAAQQTRNTASQVKGEVQQKKGKQFGSNGTGQESGKAWDTFDQDAARQEIEELEQHRDTYGNLAVWHREYTANPGAWSGEEFDPTDNQAAYDDLMERYGTADIDTLIEEKTKALQEAIDEQNGTKSATWLQAGTFADGYQTGDVLKGGAATVTDAREDFTAGLLGIGEKALDAMVYLAPYAAEAQFAQNGGYYNTTNAAAFRQQNDSAKALAAKFIAKDLYDENQVAKAITFDPVGDLLGVDTERDSFLGEKADSLVQSGGQLAGNLALSAANIPGWVVTGATSFGSEAESALHQNATYEQAGLSAAINAAGEVLSEKISGAVKLPGSRTLSELTDNLLEKVSNTTVRKLLKYGIDIGGEGVEEVVSDAVGKFGQWLTYQNDQSLQEMFTSDKAREQAWDAFLGGVFLGSGGAGVQTVAKNSTYKSIYGSSAQELVQEGLESPVGTESRTLAEKYQAKLNAGKKLSGGELSDLVQANEKQIQAEENAKVQTAVESRLTALGETGQVRSLAEALTKQASGEHLTLAQHRMIANSTFGQQVASEMDALNVESGQRNSAWMRGVLFGNNENAARIAKLPLAASIQAEPARAETLFEQALTQRGVTQRNAEHAVTALVDAAYNCATQRQVDFMRYMRTESPYAAQYNAALEAVFPSNPTSTNPAPAVGPNLPDGPSIAAVAQNPTAQPDAVTPTDEPFSSTKAKLLSDRQNAETEKQYGIKYGDTNVNFEYINSGEYNKKFLALTDNENINKSAYNIAKEMLTHCYGTEHEDLYLMNAEDGSIFAKETGSKGKLGVVYSDEFRERLAQCKEKGIRIIGIHNHPQGTPPSVDDFRKAQENGYLFGIVFGHNGQIYKFETPVEPISRELAESIARDICIMVNGGTDIDRACRLLYDTHGLKYIILDGGEA